MRRPSLGLVLYVLWTIITVSWWALAFAPLPATAPDWLVRTRQVCFGTLDNGLPDTYGWLTLILSPLSILAGLIMIWGRSLADDILQLTRSVAGWAVLVALFVPPAVGAVWVGERTARARSLAGAFRELPAGEPLPSDYPQLFRKAPSFSLVNQRGETITNASLLDKVVVMTFAYAHCSTVCPVVIKTLERGTSRVRGVDFAAVVITLDPYRDTPSSLPALAAGWGLSAGTHLLSGSPTQVNAVLASYNVAVERDENTGEIGHLPIFYVLDKQGNWVYAFNNPPPEWITEAIERLGRGERTN